MSSLFFCGKTLVVCVLLFGSTVCQQEPEIVCPANRNYDPIKVTSPYMFPYTVLIVRVEPKPIQPDGLTGTIVTPRWVLTRASIIIGRIDAVKEWGIAGPNTNELELSKTKIYPVDKIKLSPFHDSLTEKSPFNMLVLRMKWTDDDIIPVGLAGRNNIDSITEVNVVYWMEEGGSYYRKYTTYFCPLLRAMRLKCRVYNRRPHLCLAGGPEGNEEVPNSPCGPGAKTLGAGLFTQNQFLGIYMGVDNSKETWACDKPGKRFYHGGLRVQLDYDESSPEIDNLISWINGSQKNYYSTSTRRPIRTTERGRLKPSSLWQFCGRAEHISNPLLLLILVFVLVVSALLV